MMRIRKAAGIAAAVAAGTGLACTGAAVFCAAKACKKVSARVQRRVQGKVVVITGGSRGLGLALAEEFGRRGARLVLAARDGEELERARRLLLQWRAVQAESDVMTFPCDLRKPEDADALVQRATAHFGHIDMLVNNAGIMTVGPVENHTAESFREAMEANFFSGLHCTLAVLPQMLARKSGNIIHISSIGGKIAFPHLLPYTASKFAVTGFSEGLHAEVRSKGIRVLTVCPGLMRTGSHGNARFTGDAVREYRWFSLAAALPGVSASARAAARRIVHAATAGKSEITITPQAMFAARFGNLMPSLTARAMQLVNLALPQPVPGTSAVFRGDEVRELEVRPAMRFAHAASRRYNQTD
ncbi:SDR family NAD(P)-dependent oxidoreductase [Paracidobacterium acidisoli]|nr:SDR family NAD(P)-dependent oxidoreductase [Paracidobacterium acidisoli]MBT9333066.1 SDR family NAD(P)-dependent oxidoreductase [Paracidobacterium acidisoli]